MDENIKTNNERSGKTKEFFRALKFILFSISAGIIQIVSFTLLNEVARLQYWLSYGIALVLSVVWNFTFNRKFTFHSASNVPVAMLKVLAYYAVFTPLSILLENHLTANCHWNEYLVTAINMVINFVTEFLYQRFFVFGKSLDTDKNQNKNDVKDNKECQKKNKKVNKTVVLSLIFSGIFALGYIVTLILVGLKIF